MLQELPANLQLVKVGLFVLLTELLGAPPPGRPHGSNDLNISRSYNYQVKAFFRNNVSQSDNLWIRHKAADWIVQYYYEEHISWLQSKSKSYREILSPVRWKVLFRGKFSDTCINKNLLQSRNNCSSD